MNPRFPHLSRLDPFTHIRNESSLPPEPRCVRLSDVLALMDSQIGAALLDATGRLALNRVLNCIPARLSTFWGLETRLGASAPRVDLLWEVRQGSGGIPTLAGRNPEPSAAAIAGALLERSLFWQELGRFAGEWLDHPDWLRRLGNLWLEADIAAASSGAKLDACLDRPSLFWGPNPRMPGSDRDLLRRLATLGQRFYGLEVDHARLDAIADALPAEGKVFQMGVMGSRAMPVARLCVKDLDSGMKVRWLAEIEWPGDLACLTDTLVHLEPLCGKVALNIDVLPGGVGPKLGLEIYPAERMLSTDTWQPLWDELLSQGLARVDKLEALKDFPSYRRYRQLGSWRRTPPLGFPALITNLHHLKLAFVGNTVRESKAYLGVYRPVMDYSQTRGDDMEGGGGWL